MSPANRLDGARNSFRVFQKNSKINRGVNSAFQFTALPLFRFLAQSVPVAMLSTMIGKPVDATNHGRIAEFGQRVLDGGQINRDEALWLFGLESSADIYDLL